MLEGDFYLDAWLSSSSKARLRAWAESCHSTTNGTATHVWKENDMFYQCSKCNSDMEEGFSLEKGDGGILSSETWVSGKPEKHWLSGLSLKDKTVYDVSVFRCTACGYLDSYALPKR